jgi:hypothetical protein
MQYRKILRIGNTGARLQTAANVTPSGTIKPSPIVSSTSMSAANSITVPGLAGIPPEDSASFNCCNVDAVAKPVVAF